MGGYITTPYGKLSVEFDRKGGVFTLEIPEGTEAEFAFGKVSTTLNAGVHKINI